MSAPRLVSRLSVPPGGFFFAIGPDRVESRTYQGIIPRVRMLMAKHGMEGSPEEALAAYMCPRLGPAARGYCAGDFGGSPDVPQKEAFENSAPYLSKPVETFDRIEGRMVRCQSCPEHFRAWCVTCTGHYQAMRQAFGPRRPRLAVDSTSGVCKRARAYEAAIASVAYGPDEKIWEGAPETCWRRQDV